MHGGRAGADAGLDGVLAVLGRHLQRRWRGKLCALPGRQLEQRRAGARDGVRALRQRPKVPRCRRLAVLGRVWAVHAGQQGGGAAVQRQAGDAARP
jgi:hypothetical protein